MMRFDSIQVTNIRFKSSQIYISLDESIESLGYNMLLMLGLNQTLSISISLIPKNSEKRILLCSGMIYGLKQENMN
jgi:hypothetical protein